MSSHEPGASTVTEVTVHSIVAGTRAANIGGVTVSGEGRAGVGDTW